MKAYLNDLQKSIEYAEIGKEVAQGLEQILFVAKAERIKACAFLGSAHFSGRKRV